jgi:hypothetical protein
MKSLTSFFVHKGAVSPRVLQEVLLHQTLKGGSIGVNLLEKKAMTEMSLVQMTGQFHRLLVVSLQDLVTVPADATGLVGRDLVCRLKALPFDIEGENIYIATFQPPVKKDEMMIRNITGKIPRFFVASPLSIAVALWIHYRVEIPQRLARIIERINREEHPLVDDILEEVEPDRRAHLMAVLERRWEVFPRLDEKRETLVEFSEEQEDESDEEEEKWGEESGEGESDDEIFSKYIVINRIGKRPRRPSGIFIRSPAAGEPSRPAPAGEPGPEAPPGGSMDVAGQRQPVAPEKEAKQLIQGFPIPIMGMLTMSEVLAKVEDAGGASEVIDAIHEYATQFFDFVMLFRYRKGRFELSTASSRGWGYKVEEFSQRHLYSAGLPESIMKFAKPCTFLVPEGHPIEKMIIETGRSVPPNAILIPISVQDRVVVVIYGDNEKMEVKFDDVKDLFHTAWMASRKLLSFIIEKRK